MPKARKPTNLELAYAAKKGELDAEKLPTAARYLFKHFTKHELANLVPSNKPFEPQPGIPGAVSHTGRAVRV